MLLSSILGVAVIGLIGAVSGRTALREVESERLIEMRESQKRAVQALFRELTSSLIVQSGGFGINEATANLSTAFAQLANANITPAEEQTLVNYYENDMIKPIKRITGNAIDLKAVLPSSNAQKYLQAHYTAAPRPTADSPRRGRRRRQRVVGRQRPLRLFPARHRHPFRLPGCAPA